MSVCPVSFRPVSPHLLQIIQLNQEAILPGYIDRDIYRVSSDSQYERLCKLLQDLVLADCWAISVNDELLYDGFYNSQGSHREKILDSLVRFAIGENIHRHILCDLHRQSQTTILRFFMFGVDTWFIQATYDPDLQHYTLQHFKKPIAEETQ